MAEQFAVSLAQWENFQFLVDFNQDGVADLLTDEDAPLGENKGPNPSRILAAAVGNCLASSLLFCLRKSHIDTRGFDCVVSGELQRNEAGRLRVRELNVKLQPKLAAGDAEKVARCQQIFEDYCIVTQSIREGLTVNVEVAPITTAADEITVM